MKLEKDLLFDIRDRRIDSKMLKENSGIKTESKDIKEIVKSGVLKSLRSKSYDISIVSKEVVTNMYDSNCQYIVGYRIKNNSNEPIKDVFLNDEKITIGSKKEQSLPTKWFTLLMSRMIYGYKTLNGEVIVPNEVCTIDENFSNSFVDVDIPVSVVGVLDLLYQRISIKNKTYEFLRNSKILNLVDEEDECNAAKLIAFSMI